MGEINSGRGRRSFLAVTLAAGAAGIASAVQAQTISGVPDFSKTSPTKGNASIAGRWLYRSLRNSTDPNIDFAKLPLLIAILDIPPYEGDQFTGTLTATANSEAGVRHIVQGAVKGDRFKMRATQGSDTTQGWVYDYEGWIVPQWDSGVDQIQTFAGSVRRVAAHAFPGPGGGTSIAGASYSIIGTKIA